MRPPKYPARSAAWQAELRRLLLEELPLADHGRHLTREMLARVVVWMSAARATLTQAAARLALPVSDETLRQAWHASLPEPKQLEGLVAGSGAAWRRRLAHARRKRGFDVAIDLHHQPYYGQPVEGVFRAAVKCGTKRFWSVATAVIVQRGERLTLAVVPVTSNRMEEALEALWQQLKPLRLKVRWLLLDRGFYSAEVVAWLQRHRQPFLMPMIRRGRRSRGKRPGTGTAPFFQRGRRGFTQYTWQQRRRQRWVTVQVAIVPHRDRRRRPLVYAYYGRLPHLAACAALYRKRFGIESSYRQARQSSGWTTSREPRWRRLLIVLSLVLRNLSAQQPAAQPARPHRQRWTYAHFLDMLLRAFCATLLPSPPLHPP